MASDNEPKSEREWHHVHYEWWMLLLTARRLRGCPPLKRGDASYIAVAEREIDRNAWLESFLVHTRALLEFLGWTKVQVRDDDLRSPIATTPNERLLSLVEEMHKRIMHVTRRRLEGDALWPCDRIAHAVSEAMAIVCANHETPLAKDCFAHWYELKATPIPPGFRWEDWPAIIVPSDISR